jgi:hypothetical protein
MRTLEIVTAEATVIYNRITKDYAAWGKLMLEAKALVPHGQFGKYLEEHFPEIGDRQAQRYMKVSREDKTLAAVTSRGSSISKTTHESEMEREPNLERGVRASQSMNRKLLKECSIVPGLLYSWDSLDLSEMSGLELQQLRDGCMKLVGRIDAKRSEQWPRLVVTK